MNWFSPVRFRPESLVCDIRDCVTQGRFGFTTLLTLHSTACSVISISVCEFECVCTKAVATGPFESCSSTDLAQTEILKG